MMAVDGAGRLPLHYAAMANRVAEAKERLAAGDDPNLGNTPLFVAVFNSRGRGDLIAVLRQRGADPLEANNSGQTPVGLARLIGNYDVAQFFADMPG